mmetsp:Transcript_73236/g.160290  ORF Transcript_73236/g.160290 Transcript_73236/m.160290 type:complete len:729 (-) Transcript_73236:6-2192(-)
MAQELALSSPSTLSLVQNGSTVREQMAAMIGAGLHVFNPEWQGSEKGGHGPNNSAKGKRYSGTFRETTLKILGSDEQITFPVQICTKVIDVKEALAKHLMVDPEILSFVVKQGCTMRKQNDVEEVGRVVTVKGIKSFKMEKHKWPHPTAVIGAGYHGLKTCMMYAKSGDHDFVCFDRYNRVGGYCWITAANKHSKLQTEFGAFHVWWGEEMLQENCHFPGKEWGIWPRKEKVLEHFHFAAERYGILPNIRFRCNVTSIDTIGPRSEHSHYYNLGVQSLDGPRKTDEVACSVIFNYPGSMTKNRIIDYPGEDEFDGTISYGMADDCPYDKLGGNRIAILGNGAFAVENARTAIEYGCRKVYIVTRRKNLASPRVPCWFVHQGPAPTPGALVLKMFQPMYEATGFGDPWKFWSVHASSDRSRVHIIQNSRFGIGDVTFLAVACGLLEYVQDTLKRCSRHTLHLTGGGTIDDIQVILKSLGLLGDFEVDRMHKMKQMVGQFCDGDWRRVLLIDATGMNAANFTTFSTGISTKGFVNTYKYLYEHPHEYYKMEKDGLLHALPCNAANEKEDKPAYVTDVKFAMSSGIIMDGLCPRLAILNDCDPVYKYRMYHACHPLDYFLDTAMKEWDHYQELWKTQNGLDAPYQKYPYTREMIEEYFQEYSRNVAGWEVRADGKMDHWPEIGGQANKAFGSVPQWAKDDNAFAEAQKAMESDHIKWWGDHLVKGALGSGP